jgi:hydrogenase expression/formation protein HypC
MCLAIPGRIVELVADLSPSAIVEVTGVRRRVDLGLLQDDMPAVGDWVLIHVGFAMSRISEEQAADTMQSLAILGEDRAAMEEVRGYGLGDKEFEDGAASSDASSDASSAGGTNEIRR